MKAPPRRKRGGARQFLPSEGVALELLARLGTEKVPVTRPEGELVTLPPGRVPVAGAADEPSITARR